MGSWSHGNFDDDTSADHLSILTSRLLEEIADAMNNPRDLEPDEYWGCAVPCNIEILNVFAKQRWAGVCFPEPDVAAQWKKIYLEVWEEKIDDLNSDSNYKERRREVIEKTFDEFLYYARQKYA